MNKTTYINLLTPLVRNARRLGILPNSPMVNDRALEYGFMFQHLDFVKDQKILDVGYLESPLSFMLAGLGAQVYALDLRPCPIAYPGVTPMVGDIRKTEFEDNFFDRIVAISTVEHLGIATRYNSYGDDDADRKALHEMGRILKDDGKIIITVPFGKLAKDSVQRTYDKQAIEKLIEGFELEEMQYAKNTGNFWKLANYDEVKDTVGYHANVLISLRKKNHAQ